MTTAALGAIDNGDVLLSAVTAASFALFLPASREGGEVYFGTRTGRVAFLSTLGALVLTAAATAFSTVASFWSLVASLAMALLLGAWALRANRTLHEREQRAERVVRGRRGGSTARCHGFRRDGERCRNGAPSGPYCTVHA